ncbi:unnamed protein product [Cuscuta epithymum]|uniref:DUF4283 domain-containing protein n=1 Tax=Cuscuta epithymum TaxID=186058 RepID=A0AAV0CJH3_9ASTE|nr:unnamed protein product [Cuscuta epithymum]
MTRKWGVEVDVKSHSKGWVIFKFKTEEDRVHVLAEGPYVLHGKTMFLKELSEDFSTNSEEFLKVPIWVKFPKLSMRLWKAKEMGTIASQVGVPITADKVTQDTVYTHFARVLIEIDVTKPPVMQFPIVPPSGKEYMQQIIYETYPEYCFHCKKYGHHPFSSLVLNPPKGKAKQVSANEKGKEIVLVDEPPFVEVNRNKKKTAYVRKEAPAKDVASTSKTVGPKLQPQRKEAPHIANKELDNVPSKLPVKLPAMAAGSATTMAIPPPNVDVFEWEGRRVVSVHEIELDDVVNKFVTKEDGAHEAFVKKRHQIKSYIPVTRLGRNLQKETNPDLPAMAFTDPCLVALPGVKRTRTWYAFNLSIFFLNVACFFDVQANQNLDFLRTKEQLAIQEAANLLPPAAYEENRGDQSFNGGKGYLVTNMYEMGIDDVVTMVILNEKSKTVA